MLSISSPSTASGSRRRCGFAVWRVIASQVPSDGIARGSRLPHPGEERGPEPLWAWPWESAGREPLPLSFRPEPFSCPSSARGPLLSSARRPGTARRGGRDRQRWLGRPDCRGNRRRSLAGSSLHSRSPSRDRIGRDRDRTDRATDRTRRTFGAADLLRCNPLRTKARSRILAGSNRRRVGRGLKTRLRKDPPAPMRRFPASVRPHQIAMSISYVSSPSDGDGSWPLAFPPGDDHASSLQGSSDENVFHQLDEAIPHSSRPNRWYAYAASAKSAQVFPLASPMPVGWSHSSAGTERSLEPLSPLQHNDLAPCARPKKADVTVGGTSREEWGGTHGITVKVVSLWGILLGEAAVSLGSDCACGIRQIVVAVADKGSRIGNGRRVLSGCPLSIMLGVGLSTPLYVVRTAVAGTLITRGPLLVPQSNRGYVYHPFARL